jgi:hypothetical protein
MSDAIMSYSGFAAPRSQCLCGAITHSGLNGTLVVQYNVQTHIYIFSAVPKHIFHYEGVENAK